MSFCIAVLGFIEFVIAIAAASFCCCCTPWENDDVGLLTSTLNWKMITLWFSSNVGRQEDLLTWIFWSPQQYKHYWVYNLKKNVCVVRQDLPKNKLSSKLLFENIKLSFLISNYICDKDMKFKIRSGTCKQYILNLLHILPYMYIITSCIFTVIYLNCWRI